MMYATKIKMKPDCFKSKNLLEIDEIYIIGANPEGYYSKAGVYKRVKENPGSIKVYIFPFPELIPAKSKHGEKYVRSEPNDSTHDNLLKLPRE